MGAVGSKQWRECYKTKQNTEQFFFFFSFPFHCRVDEGSTVVCKLSQIVKEVAFKRPIVFLKKMRGFVLKPFLFFKKPV